MKRSTIQFNAVVVSSLLVIGLVLSSCALRGKDEETTAMPSVVTGDQVRLESVGTLMCTQACSERGFCGTDNNAIKVVILNSWGPATVNQDLTMPADTVVNILGHDNREVEIISTKQRFFVDYYLVNAAERGQGWVAGWCIGQ
jgi:hypothetical protein